MNPLTEGKKITLGYDYFATGFTGPQLSEAYYRLVADKGQERLLFETATIDQMDEVYNPGDPCDENDRMTTEEMVMEAIRVQRFARTESKMTALVRVFNGYLKDKNIEAQPPVIGTPKKAGLFATVTVQVPFSDGQVVSIIFHSPEGNKMKITADDEIIAFRWLLNKRDITHVVSPENDAEVSLQEIGKRTAQLVEKNSARFQVMQKDLVEQKKRLEEVKAQAEGAVKQHDDLMGKLKEGQDALETMNAKIANLKDRIEKQKAFNEDLQTKIDSLKAAKAGNDGKAAGGDTPKTEAEMKAEQERAAYEEKLAALGSELTGRGFVDNGMGGVWNKEGFGHVQASGVEGYSITVGLADGSKKAFSSATIAGFDKQATKALTMIDKKLAELKKSEVPSNGPQALIGPNMTPEDEKRILADLASLGREELTKRHDAIQAYMEGPDFEVQSDDYKKSLQNTEFLLFTAKSDSGDSIDDGDPIESKVWTLPIETVKAMPVDEFNKAYAALEEENYHTENVVLMAKRRGTADDVAEAESLLKDQEAAGELTFEMSDRRHNLMDKIASHSDPSGEAAPEPPPEPTEPAAVGVLNDILSGKYDGDSTKLSEALDQAASDLEKDGKAEEYDALLNQAADHLTEILKKEAA